MSELQPTFVIVGGWIISFALFECIDECLGELFAEDGASVHIIVFHFLGVAGRLHKGL